MIIGIAGGSGAGKSTLAAALEAALAPECVQLCHDWYYRDQRHLEPAERLKTNYDHPGALETGLLVSHLRMLAEGSAAAAPQYDYVVHTRRAETRIVLPARHVLVEGLFVLADPALRDVLDLKIFLDCAAETRMGRRVQRDMEERGRSAEQARTQFMSSAEPMFQRYVHPTRVHATLVLDGTLPPAALVPVVLETMARVTARDGGTP